MILPDVLENEQKNERKVGFEIEYAELSLKEVSEIIQSFFGGKINSKLDTVYEVLDTQYGDFTIELDAIPIQKLSEKSKALQSKNESSIVDEVQVSIHKNIEKVSQIFTPFEIVTPPMPFSSLPELQKLESKLRSAGAVGTKGAVQYAFGLHINPEVTSLKVGSLLKHLQAFLMIEVWLKEKHKVDFSRKLTNFIDPFPSEYLDLILNETYQPDLKTFIKDYHQFNPTRNRSLDMLPVFAFVEEDYVRELYGDKEKINKRPTYHYRLPNCSIGQDDWSFETEWALWLKVEKIAHNEKTLFELMKLWQQNHNKKIKLDFMWIDKVENFIQENDI